VSSDQQVPSRRANETPIDLVGASQGWKVSGLLSLYQQTHAETTRYGDCGPGWRSTLIADRSTYPPKAA
jgi:hypothetical protein